MELSLRMRGPTIDLGSHASNYLLLTLARQRDADRDKGLSEASCGWVFQDVLAHDLATESENINVDVHRIRRRFAEHVENPADIVERRPRTRQLRLGAGNVDIQRI